MKENKGVYVTKRDIKENLIYKEYQLYSNRVITSEIVEKYGKIHSKDVAIQYNCKRDNMICTCRNQAGVKRHPEARYFSTSPKQIYTYHRSRSFTDIGVGSVKALQKKKVRRIYLPQTEDRGVGSSDLSSFVRKNKHSKNNSYYDHKKTSSKCVGGCKENTAEGVMSAKVSPIIQTRSGTTSPKDPIENQNNTEIGSNTIDKQLVTATTQIEADDIKKDEHKSVTEAKPKSIIKKVSPQKEGQHSEVIVPTDFERTDADKKIKEMKLEKSFSSDSLVQHVHNLEVCSDNKLDPMENKIEKEYQKIFLNKSKDHKSGSSTEKPIPDFKTASLLRRRFDAIRRTLGKKEDSKKNVVVSKTPSQGSLPSHRDASVTSDPPSLEGRSYSNTKAYRYNPYPSMDNRDPPQVSYKKSYTGRKDHGSKQWSQANTIDSEYAQGVKGMFKLWGKKFNLDDELNKKETTPKQSSYEKKDYYKKDSALQQSSHFNADEPKEQELIKIIDKPALEEKKEGKKFFFFKKKSKDKAKVKDTFKSKKGVTAGRCEIRDGLMIKIGGAKNQPPPFIPPDKRKSNKSRESYEELIRKAWLMKYLTNPIESKNSVQVRWNNRTYATSSSTIFELMENVYKDTGVVFKSKSEFMTDESSYYAQSSSSRPQHVNFVQNVEAWMIPAIRTLNDQHAICNKNASDRDMAVRISNQKWFIDKSQAFAHKIEVVLHSKNFVKLENSKSNTDYLRIDIPKGFFSDTSTDDTPPNQTSEEEVYKIVEYETLKSSSELNESDKNDQFDTGDHEINDLKVTISVKENKQNYESTILETVIKRPPMHRDVVIQNSNVYIPKKCDVIGVGIITQRDVREVRKPILKIVEYESDEESERSAHISQKKCEFAESYLQDYYRNWTPLGIDLFSWCVSDSHLKCSSEDVSPVNLNNGDVTKSCPNILDDYVTTTIVSSYCHSSGSQCCTMPGEAPIETKKGNFFKQKSKKKGKNETDDFRILPKDSLEVVKKRKLYAASKKSNWIGDDETRPYSVPSMEERGAQDTLFECPKPCCKVQRAKPKKNSCNKHVSLPDCETMNDMLLRQLGNDIPGILSLGNNCEKCKKKDSSKRALVNTKRTCEIEDPKCKKYCQTDKDAPCSKDNTPPCSPPLSTMSSKTCCKSISPPKSGIRSPPKCQPRSPPKGQTRSRPMSPKSPSRSPPRSSACLPCCPPRQQPKTSPPLSTTSSKTCCKSKSPLKSATRSPPKSPECLPCCPPKPQLRSPPCPAKSPPICPPKSPPICAPRSPPISPSRAPPTSPPRSSPITPSRCPPKSPPCESPFPSRSPTRPSPQSSSSECVSPITSGPPSPRQSCSSSPPCTKLPKPIKLVACKKSPCKDIKKKCPKPPKKSLPQCSTNPCNKPGPACSGCNTSPCNKLVTGSDQNYPWPVNSRVSNESLNSPCKPKVECIKSCPISAEKTKKIKKDDCVKNCENKPRDCPPTPPTTLCPDPPNLAIPPQCPKQCSTRSKISGLFLKKLPSRKKTCASDCKAWSQVQGEEGVIRLNSREKITIRLRQENPSTEEIRECVGVKIQDEDGQTLCERKDYIKPKQKQENFSQSWCKPQCGHDMLVGDMYTDSHINRIETVNKVSSLDKSQEEPKSKSDSSVANMIEINFKLRVTQGDKTTEIDIGNDDSKNNTKNTPAGERLQEVYAMKSDIHEEAVAHHDSVEDTNPKNDINIRILIKNFKPKSKRGSKCVSNREQRELVDEFSRKISNKFQTLSTGYSTDIKDQNPNSSHVFSVHRATIDLTTSAEKSSSQPDRQIVIDSECITVSDNSTEKSDQPTEIIEIDDGTNKKVEDTFSNNQICEIKSTEKEDKNYEVKSVTLVSATDTDDQDASLELYNKTSDEPTTDLGDDPTDLMMKTSDEQDTDLCNKTSDEPDIDYAIETSTKTRYEEKKNMLKKVFENANYLKKPKNKTRIQRLKDMLKAILTSDSSEPEEMVVASNELTKDVMYPSLKPNFFKDSESLNNFYRGDSDIVSEICSATKPRYPTEENNSICSGKESDEWSEEDLVNQGCVCSKVAAKLTGKMYAGGGCCCSKKVQMTEETHCDLRTEEDFKLLNYKSVEFMDVETQNSKYMASKVTSVCINTNASILNSVTNDNSNVVKTNILAVKGNIKNKISTNKIVSSEEDTSIIQTRKLNSTEKTHSSDFETNKKSKVMTPTTDFQTKNAKDVEGLNDNSKAVRIDILPIKSSIKSTTSRIKTEKPESETQINELQTMKINSIEEIVTSDIQTRKGKSKDVTYTDDFQTKSKDKANIKPIEDSHELKKVSIKRTYSKNKSHSVKSYELKKLDRNTKLGISDDDKVVFLEQQSNVLANADFRPYMHEKHKKHRIQKEKSSKITRAVDILQLYETKKAVLEIYAEKTETDYGEHLVAKLPKFVHDTESEICRNFEDLAKSRYKSVCKRNIVTMSIGRKFLKDCRPYTCSLWSAQQQSIGYKCVCHLED